MEEVLNSTMYFLRDYCDIYKPFSMVRVASFKSLLKYCTTKGIKFGDECHPLVMKFGVKV